MSAKPVSAAVVIDADPSEVYEYFTRAEAMVLWMGEKASLDPRPDGEFSVDVNGTAIRGRYLELEPPNRLVIAWGFLESETLPPAASTVEVLLSREGTGTRVVIIHRGLDAKESAKHDPGWCHFLRKLATIVVDRGVNGGSR